jgi:hypothetical protein
MASARDGAGTALAHPVHARCVVRAHVAADPQFVLELCTHWPLQRNDPVGHWQDAPAPLFTHTWPSPQHVPKHLARPDGHGSAWAPRFKATAKNATRAIELTMPKTRFVAWFLLPLWVSRPINFPRLE